MILKTKTLRRFFYTFLNLIVLILLILCLKTQYSSACGFNSYYPSKQDAVHSWQSKHLRVLMWRLLTSLPQEHEARWWFTKMLRNDGLRWGIRAGEVLHQACSPYLRSNFGTREEQVRTWCAQYQPDPLSFHGIYEDDEMYKVWNHGGIQSDIDALIALTGYIDLPKEQQDILDSHYIKRGFYFIDKEHWIEKIIPLLSVGMRKVPDPSLTPEQRALYQQARALIPQNLDPLEIHYVADPRPLIKKLKTTPKPANYQKNNLSPQALRKLNKLLKRLPKAHASYLRGAQLYHDGRSDKALKYFSQAHKLGLGGSPIFMEALLQARQSHQPLQVIAQGCQNLRAHYQSNPERYLGSMSLIANCESYMLNDLNRYHRYQLTAGVVSAWESDLFVAELYQSLHFQREPNLRWIQRRFELLTALPFQHPISRAFQTALRSDPFLQYMFVYALQPTHWFINKDSYYTNLEFDLDLRRNGGLANWHFDKLKRLFRWIDQLSTGELPPIIAALGLSLHAHLELNLYQQPGGVKELPKTRTWIRDLSRWQQAAQNHPLSEYFIALLEHFKGEKERALERLRALSALYDVWSPNQLPQNFIPQWTLFDLSLVSPFKVKDLLGEMLVEQGDLHTVIEHTLTYRPPRLDHLATLAEELMTPEELLEIDQKLTTEFIQARRLNPDATRVFRSLTLNRMMRLRRWDVALKLDQDPRGRSSDYHFGDLGEAQLSVLETVELMQNADRAEAQLKERLDDPKKERNEGYLKKNIELRETVFMSACAMRHMGMSYFGTMFKPDGGITLGEFNEDSTTLPNAFKRLPNLDERLKASQEERGQPNGLRFMYRYAAADIAVKAAHLNHPRSRDGWMLWHAHYWISREPDYLKHHKNLKLYKGLSNYEDGAETCLTRLLNYKKSKAKP